MNGLESRFDNWLFALDVSSFDFINGNITRVIEHQAELLKKIFLSSNLGRIDVKTCRISYKMH